MITPPHAESQSQSPPAVAYEPGFEVVVQAFWAKNRNLILGICTAALLGIIGREGWQFYAARQEEGVRAAYAKVADRPEQLGAFATANAKHVLAGVAWLRLADSKYSAGDYRAAAENYCKAVTGLKQPALLGRARIGAAMSQVNGTDKAAGEAALKTISVDSALPKVVRVEAMYHLASLAHEAGNAAEVTRLVAETGKIDASSSWSQRATVLLTSKP